MLYRIGKIQYVHDLTDPSSPSDPLNVIVVGRRKGFGWLLGTMVRPDLSALWDNPITKERLEHWTPMLHGWLKEFTERDGIETPHDVFREVYKHTHRSNMQLQGVTDQRRMPYLGRLQDQQDKLREYAEVNGDVDLSSWKSNFTLVADPDIEGESSG